LASCWFGIVSGYRQLKAVCSRVVFQSGLAREQFFHGEQSPGWCFETFISGMVLRGLFHL
jgi:hypothetical protein